MIHNHAVLPLALAMIIVKVILLAVPVAVDARPGSDHQSGEICASFVDSAENCTLDFFIEISIAKRTFEHILWSEVCKYKIVDHPSPKVLSRIETEHKTRGSRLRVFCSVSTHHRNRARGYYCAWHILDDIDEHVFEKTSFPRFKTKTVQAGRRPPRFYGARQYFNIVV